MQDYSCYSYTITPSTSTFDAMHAAKVKMILFLPGALVGKNGDCWIKEEVLENRVQFSSRKILTTVHNSGIVSDVGVPKVVSAFQIIKGPHLRGES